MRVQYLCRQNGEAVAAILRRVPSQIRNQREIARALYCRRELPLMSRAGPAQSARKNFALIGDEPSERSIILVIDPAHAPLAKGTTFLWSSHLS